MKGMEKECRATNTQFCVWFTMPPGGKPPRSHPKADTKPTDMEMVRAFIEVKISLASATREIEGMKKLALPTDDPALSTVRMALMSDPSVMEHTSVNLMQGNPKKWADLLSTARVKYEDNASQLAIFESLQNVTDHMTACIGPSGAGKTEVLSDMVNDGVMCGNRTIVRAVSNNAVDKAANSCWEKFPKEERKHTSSFGTRQSRPSFKPC